jgi:hypothetical protein
MPGVVDDVVHGQAPEGGIPGREDTRSEGNSILAVLEIAVPARPLLPVEATADEASGRPAECKN